MLFNIWHQPQTKWAHQITAEGKFEKSSERKSPVTELKTKIKISNSNKGEFNKQDTVKGKVIVKIVTMDVKIFGKLAGSSHPNRTGKQAAKNINNCLNLKKI